MSYKSEGPADHLLFLWLHVLEDVVLAAQDGEGEWERVQQISVRMVPPKPAPGSLSHLLHQIWLRLLQNCGHSTAELEREWAHQ